MNLRNSPFIIPTSIVAGAYLLIGCGNSPQFIRLAPRRRQQQQQCHAVYRDAVTRRAILRPLFATALAKIETRQQQSAP